MKIIKPRLQSPCARDVHPLRVAPRLFVSNELVLRDAGFWYLYSFLSQLPPTYVINEDGVTTHGQSLVMNIYLRFIKIY